MTARADAGPRRVDAEPRAHEAAGLSLFVSVAGALVVALIAAMGRIARVRAPDAARLTDRQLADIGLTRADLPYDRDRRR